MKSNIPEKCVLCNSQSFNKFEKYSYALQYTVKYLQCQSCGLITVPLSGKFALSKIYDEVYFLNTDYGWKGRAELVLNYIRYINLLIPIKKMAICDFGAGNGYLTSLLIKSGFNIIPYEPYLKESTFLDITYYRDTPFHADVLLMVEVFEHFTDALEEIKKILNDFNYPKLIIFTTELTDNITETLDNWVYLNPDAGHFTIWSEKSLLLLGNIIGYRLISIGTYLHIFCKSPSHSNYWKLKLLSIIPNFIVSLKRMARGRSN